MPTSAGVCFGSSSQRGLAKVFCSFNSINQKQNQGNFTTQSKMKSLDFNFVTSMDIPALALFVSNRISRKLDNVFIQP